MNKNQLVAAVAERADLPQKDIKRIINAITEVILETMQERSEIRLVGFGTFKIRSRADRIGRNPKTGQIIKISAKEVPVFIPGKKLKEMLRS